MRIGIELRGLDPGALGDTAPLVRGILDALFREHPGHRYHLFCTADTAGLFPSPPRNVTCDALPADRYLALLCRDAGMWPLDVLVRTAPLDGPLRYPADRQVELSLDPAGEGRESSPSASARSLIESCARAAERAAPVPVVPAPLRLRWQTTRGIRRAWDWVRSRLPQWRRHSWPTLRPRLGVHHQHPPRPLVLPRLTARLPMRPPVISIVTPSFNQAGFLERTIRSVLDQGYPRLEYILQDGGSTDGTAAILGRYLDRLARCESRRDRGQTHALNLGFRHATGDVLAYLNSDDILLPGALAYVARFFHDHPDVDVLYSHRLIIDPDDREVGRWWLPTHDDGVLRWEDFVPQETLFWRRRIWDRVGGALDESFQFAMDWDLLLRFQAAGARFVRVPRFLGAFRVHPWQKTSSRMEELGLPEIARLRQRSFGRPVTADEVREAVRPYLRRHLLVQVLHRLGLGA